MNNNKKNIIINEISYWKNNKLLPETYCDFLLALYTEGNQMDIDITSQMEQKRKAITIYQVFLYGLLLLLLPAMLLVIYFTELSFVLQMTIVGFFLVSSMNVTAYFIRKRVFFQVPLSITFIQLLIVSLSIIEKITNGDRLWIGGTVVVNCLLWILIGRIYRVIYLIISGIVGLAIFILTTMVF
ncbi:hypothetical protein [Metabacillus sp. FJAT-53654]|uniref:Uncharacterized protein n=1 Tax=Metabacillus rhizosphaerae TaxID=3117747 RepID=A0ABZ2MZG3_9BACI